MMHRLVLGFLTFTLILGMVSAQTDAKSFIEVAFDESGELNPLLQPQITQANMHIQSLPGPIKALFGSQRMSVELRLTDGGIETLGVVTKKNRIESFTRYAPRNPSMRIWTDESTVTTITQSRDPAGAFVDAVNQGKMKYRGLTPESAFPTFVADVVVWTITLFKAFASLIGR